MQDIMQYAKELFDVAGAWGEDLILGLESRKDRNLDDFFVDPGDKWGFPGFAEHFSPKVNLILEEIHKTDKWARQVDKLFGPRGFKLAAVRSGIGEWGKNSLVIHPTFGPWLRFVVIATDPLPRTGYDHPMRPTYNKCIDCDKCTKACPVNALQDFRIPDRKICIAWQQLGEVTTDVLQRCDLCLQACMPQRP